MQGKEYLLTDDPCARYSVATLCVQGSVIGVTGSIPFAAEAGQFSITAALSVNGSYGESANFSNTSRLYLRLPAEATLASESGQLFSTAQPVPEPQTYALMLAGLALIAGVARKRTLSQKPQVMIDDCGPYTA